MPVNSKNKKPLKGDLKNIDKDKINEMFFDAELMEFSELMKVESALKEDKKRRSVKIIDSNDLDDIEFFKKQFEQHYVFIINSEQKVKSFYYRMKGATLEEAGEKTGVSRERIRQLELQARKYLEKTWLKYEIEILDSYFTKEYVFKEASFNRDLGSIEVLIDEDGQNKSVRISYYDITKFLFLNSDGIFSYNDTICQMFYNKDRVNDKINNMFYGKQTKYKETKIVKGKEVSRWRRTVEGGLLNMPRIYKKAIQDRYIEGIEGEDYTYVSTIKRKFIEEISPYTKKIFENVNFEHIVRESGYNEYPDYWNRFKMQLSEGILLLLESDEFKDGVDTRASYVAGKQICNEQFVKFRNTLKEKYALTSKSDKSLIFRVCSVAVTYNNGVYAHPDRVRLCPKTAKKLIDYIITQGNLGKPEIYFSELFNIFRDELENKTDDFNDNEAKNINITDEYKLHGALTRFTREDGKEFADDIIIMRGKVKKTPVVKVKVIDIIKNKDSGKFQGLEIEFNCDNKLYTCEVKFGFTSEEKKSFTENEEIIKGKIIEVKYYKLLKLKEGGYKLESAIYNHKILGDTEEVNLKEKEIEG